MCQLWCTLHVLLSPLILPRWDLILPFADGEAEALKGSKRPCPLPQVTWSVGDNSGFLIQDG